MGRLSPFVLPVLLVVVVAVAIFANRPPPRPDATPDLGPLADPNDTYDPVKAGEPLPDGYVKVVGRDRIAPIYDPRFVEASESGWRDDTMVLGVALEGRAKAYPVAPLARREMVVDRLAGIPILVTW